MRYQLEPKYRKYVKGYRHLQENLEINTVKN